MVSPYFGEEEEAYEGEKVEAKARLKIPRVSLYITIC